MIMNPTTQQKRFCSNLYSFLEEYRSLLIKYNYTIDSEDGCLLEGSNNRYIGYIEVEDREKLQLYIMLQQEDGTEEKLILNV